tara:strand:+ start:104 stop:565 length:462 start_codon:yes stop_codon:yes gene_type:complete
MLKFNLLEKLQQLDAVTLTHEEDAVRSEHGEDYYSVEIDLGGGFAGDYKGGYWGDCSITDEKLNLHFLYGNVYGDDDLEEGEGNFGEGMVHLTYKGGTEKNGLAYTGKLEEKICERIEEVTNGLILADGSEQGMQGHDGDDESYLSLDLGEVA